MPTIALPLAHARGVMILYSRNPLDTDHDLWTEVDLLGELILNIIVKVSIGLHNYW